MGQNESFPGMPPPAAPNYIQQYLQQQQSAPNNPPSATNEVPVKEQKDNKNNIPKEELDEEGKKTPKEEVVKKKRLPKMKEQNEHQDQITTDMDDMNAKGDDAISPTSSTSDDKMCKKGRHGSWSYVPAEPRVAYPKVEKGDRRARELAKLAMDVVDSQHDLTKSPKEWYTGSEFDMNEPLSMADRIKNNKRIQEARRCKITSSVAISEVGSNEKKTKQTRKRRANSSIAKETTKRVKNENIRSRSQTPADQVDSSLYSTMSLEMEDIRGDSFDSHLMEMQGTSFDFFSNDMRMDHDDMSMGFTDPFHYLDQGGISMSSYSFGPPSTLNFMELPDNILEEEEEEDYGLLRDKTDKPLNSVKERRLPPSSLLQSHNLGCRYNEDGVQIKDLLLVVHSITTDTPMDQLILYLHEDIGDVWMVPTRRPEENFTMMKTGHMALILTHSIGAEELKKMRSIFIDVDILTIEQPGAILVHTEEYKTMTEDQLKSLIERNVGSILHLQKVSSGVAILLPSADKASELLRRGTEGELRFSTLKNEKEEDQIINWPIIDENWANELGFARH